VPHTGTSSWVLVCQVGSGEIRSFRRLHGGAGIEQYPIVSERVARVVHLAKAFGAKQITGSTSILPRMGRLSVWRRLPIGAPTDRRQRILNTTWVFSPPGCADETGRTTPRGRVDFRSGKNARRIAVRSRQSAAPAAGSVAMPRVTMSSRRLGRDL
jgi:hypothetical protein